MSIKSIGSAVAKAVRKARTSAAEGTTPKRPAPTASSSSEKKKTQDTVNISGSGAEEDDEPPSTQQSGGATGAASGTKSGGFGGRVGNLKLTEEQQELQRDYQALKQLDQDFDIYDNPGGGDTDGVVSYGDLEKIADGDYDEEKARERLTEAGIDSSIHDKYLERMEQNADYLLDRPELLEELDIANDSSDDHDSKIARSDLRRGISRFESELAEEGLMLPTNVEGLDGGDFEIPDEHHNHGTTGRGGENRTRELAQAQEQTVIEALNSDGPVEFTNSNGDTEMLSIRQVEDTKGDVTYELQGEDGRTIKIESELGADDTRIALGRIADYYSQTPNGARNSFDTIELHTRDGDGAAADYNARKQRIRFFDGLDYLTEAVFDHEVGHGVGYEADGNGEGTGSRLGQLFYDEGLHGAPQGWDDAIEADGTRLTEYANTNHKEDFAESWTTFVEAVEQGDTALDEFQERYPNRFEILEEVYMQMTEAA